MKLIIENLEVKYTHYQIKMIYFEVAILMSSLWSLRKIFLVLPKEQDSEVLHQLKANLL